MGDVLDVRYVSFFRFDCLMLLLGGLADSWLVRNVAVISRTGGSLREERRRFLFVLDVRRGG